MTTLVDNTIVKSDIERVCNSTIIDWERFKNKTFFITGATGGIGSFIIRCLLHANKKKSLNLKVVASVRNKEKAKSMFHDLLRVTPLKLFVGEITQKINYSRKVDYIIHCANNTSSKSFVKAPVETMDIAFNGTKEVLEFASVKKVESVVHLSSMEVYGFVESTGKFQKEDDLGYQELLQARSSYPVGKRAAETLCHSFYKEKGVPVKIARLAQTVGANVDSDDSRVYALFARSIVEQRDIILNTPGETTRSFCYITDVVESILLLLQKGENGQAYNVANKKCIAKIKDIAEMLIKKYPSSKLVFNINESEIYPKETVWALDSSKIEELGWTPKVNIEEMFSFVIASFHKQIMRKQHLQKIGVNNKLTKWEKIFSIKDTSTHRVFCLLGAKLKVKLAIFNLLYIIILRITGIKKNKIVFSNYMGSGYGCNPKYICEELLKRKKNYDIVWLVRDNVSRENFPRDVRVVSYNNREALYELATSKIWVDNYHKINFIKKGLCKSKQQTYIQTWHGSLGLKKIEKNVNFLTKDKKWVKHAAKNSSMTDIWISNSSFETEIYKDSFWEVKDVRELGHPRNDIFFVKDLDSIKKKVFKTYNIPMDKKVMLYLPSFREDESLKYYDLDYTSQIKALKNKFGSDWVFVVRLHPRVIKYSSVLFGEDSNIINACKYPDIQELLVSGDAMISDYSSCMFDFMLSRKPVFIYANDLDAYIDERGFAYPITETPFPLAKSNNELTREIELFDLEKYKKKVAAFLISKGVTEDGLASKRVADIIDSIIDKE